MTPQRWQRVNEILEQACERNPGERSAFLDQACSHDPELRSQVEGLLSSDENIGEFLAGPAMDVAGSDPGEDSGESFSSRRIGPYRILREIGHGGMGTV